MTNEFLWLFIERKDKEKNLKCELCGSHFFVYRAKKEASTQNCAEVTFLGNR
ncbi:MAG: hypothetical protein IKX31_08245 [Muribaculaceae bacterium]|nr:hypothetical protein [Muribaculaceae bacterium]